MKLTMVLLLLSICFSVFSKEKQNTKKPETIKSYYTKSIKGKKRLAFLNIAEDLLHFGYEKSARKKAKELLSKDVLSSSSISIQEIAAGTSVHAGHYSDKITYLVNHQVRVTPYGVRNNQPIFSVIVSTCRGSIDKGGKEKCEIEFEGFKTLKAEL